MKKDIIFCSGGGCTAKLGANALKSILDKLPKNKDENLLVGFDGSDDGAVYKLSEDMAIVQTLDFFPPMVDDPYIFGQIAATNALSDIYAMGGRVLTALNIVCFPESLDLNILGKILQGGNDKVIEAGGALCGGHSIVDDTVKYGLSVTGIVDPKKVKKNNDCKNSDVLLLTKPLGTGLVCTANSVDMASKEAMDMAIKSMTTLNKYAYEMSTKYEVHALTDVTGFGLLAHVLEMLGTEENLCVEVYCDKIPYIKEAKEYAGEYLITKAGQKNRNHVGNKVTFMVDDFEMSEILFDPQTSGGLLFAMPEEDAKKLLEEVKTLGLDCGIIGKIGKDLVNKIIVK